MIYPVATASAGPEITYTQQHEDAMPMKAWSPIPSCPVRLMIVLPTALPRAVRLATKTQPIDQAEIPRFVLFPDIVKHFASPGHQIEQASSRMIVRSVYLEVFGKGFYS